MKVLIYGIGGFTRRFLPTTLEILQRARINLIGFVDQNYRNFRMGYQGIRVYAPSDVAKIEFDRIYIYAFSDKGIYQDIYYCLRKDIGVCDNKIGCISDLLCDAQRIIGQKYDSNKNRIPKVYDCIQFYKEFEILQIRLEMLDPYVDYFVIVEMGRDHQGKEKPLYLKDRLEEFAKYKDKIILVHPNDSEIPEYREEDKNEYGYIWTIEQFQRRCISKGLSCAKPEDIVLISDCDEIPDPEIIRNIKAGASMPYQDVICKILETTAIALRQEYYYFYFNCRNKTRKNTTIMVKYKNLINPQIIREVMDFLPYIDYGGWHLTYFGGVKKIKEKVNAIVEGTDLSYETINERISNARDIYGRKGDEFELEVFPRDMITIPNVDKWIKRYPSFYNKNLQKTEV